MPRFPRSRTLPSLASVWPQFAGFKTTESKQRKLHDLLASVARQARGSVPRPFYSVRQVASFFQVSTSTVANVYRQLDREGLLVRKRAAGTVVPSRRMRPRVRIRSVIAVLVWLPGFLIFGDWRRFVIGLEGELRRHNFVADLIFFRQGEEGADFVERVLAHHPDLFLWFCPAPSARPTMAALIDATVRPIVIGDKPVAFDGQYYRLSWERALQRVLEEWIKNGIDTVVIPGGNRPMISATHVIEPVLQRLGLKYSFTAPPPHAITEDLDHLGHGANVGVAWDDDLWFHHLCLSVPQQVRALLQRARTLVMRPINLAPVTLTDIRVDVLRFDWPAITRRIADDIATERLFAKADPLVFEADAALRVHAAELAGHFDVE